MSCQDVDFQRPAKSAAWKLVPNVAFTAARKASSGALIWLTSHISMAPFLSMGSAVESAVLDRHVGTKLSKRFPIQGFETHGISSDFVPVFFKTLVTQMCGPLLYKDLSASSGGGPA